MRLVSARGRRLAIRSHSDYADEEVEGDYEYSGCGSVASDFDLFSAKLGLKLIFSTSEAGAPRFFFATILRKNWPELATCFCTQSTRHLQGGAAYHSQGFDDKNLLGQEVATVAAHQPMEFPKFSSSKPSE